MVEVGLTFIDQVAEVDVNVPGVMETLVAPEVVQLRVLLAPEFMPVGFAANEVIVGSEPLVEDEFEEPQLRSRAEDKRISSKRQMRNFIRANIAEVSLLGEQELLVSMKIPHGNNSVYVSCLAIVIVNGCSPLGHGLYVISWNFCGIGRSTSEG